ncbi:MAG: hypothetical protein JWO63_3255 [Frankiales bacterium]|nr:hypothetical protein [Frankiales bacterium]
MGLLSRWVRPPSEFRKLLGATDRVLAIADTGAGPDSAVVIATQYALWLPNGMASWQRVGWNEIVKATWTDGILEVTDGVLGSDGIVEDRVPARFPLAAPRNLPSVVRTRVEASIARSELVNLPAGPARIVARRVPGVDGVTWTARFDSGTPDNPADRATLVAYLARVEEAASQQLT